MLSIGSSPNTRVSVWWSTGKCTWCLSSQISYRVACIAIFVGKSGMSLQTKSTRRTAQQKKSHIVGSCCVSHLLAAAPPKQVGLAPDHNHVVPGPRRRRAPAGFQLSPLTMTISVPSSFSVGSFLGHLLHATFHTVHRRVLGPHARK